MIVPSYEVYAIKYGERMGTRGGMFVLDEPDDTPLQMDYSIWAVRNAERTMVVDLGCGREEMERRGRTFLRCPTDGLRLIGIDPVRVRDVIITHMHYDHAGNLPLFPNARFHIQQEELAFVTGPAMTHRILRDPFRVDDVIEMVRLVYGDRVVLHAGDDEIAPGITVHHINGHTRGLQSVNVHTKRGWSLSPPTPRTTMIASSKSCRFRRTKTCPRCWRASGEFGRSRRPMHTLCPATIRPCSRVTRRPRQTFQASSRASTSTRPNNVPEKQLWTPPFCPLIEVYTIQPKSLKSCYN